MSTTVAATLVADAMVRAPKVHGPGLTVAHCRAALADDHVHMLLLVEDGRLLGALVRDDVPLDAADDGPALPLATVEGRTVPPAARVDAVHASMLATGLRRLAVVDDAGVLLGLLCLKKNGEGFCSDGDVAARTAELS